MTSQEGHLQPDIPCNENKSNPSNYRGYRRHRGRRIRLQAHTDSSLPQHSRWEVMLLFCADRLAPDKPTQPHKKTDVDKPFRNLLVRFQDNSYQELQTVPLTPLSDAGKTSLYRHDCKSTKRVSRKCRFVKKRNSNAPPHHSTLPGISAFQAGRSARINRVKKLREESTITIVSGENCADVIIPGRVIHALNVA